MQEQFRTLLEKNPFETPYYIPLLLLYHTGMRIGKKNKFVPANCLSEKMRQSKALPAPEGEKVSLVCVQNNGHLILKEYLTNIFVKEGTHIHFDIRTQRN